ncbi:MAG: hypothetical protein P8J33_06155 [Pirellulaceae bacterium]|nr:hypothetical protein [Pirellulaceae bacterium]
MSEPRFPVGSRCNMVWQIRVVRRKDVKHRTIHPKKITCRGSPIKHFHPKSGARRINRIATRHPKCDWRVIWDVGHHIDATLISAAGCIEIAVTQTRTWMVDCVYIKTQTLLDPRL